MAHVPARLDDVGVAHSATAATFRGPGSIETPYPKMMWPTKPIEEGLNWHLARTPYSLAPDAPRASRRMSNVTAVNLHKPPDHGPARARRAESGLCPPGTRQARPEICASLAVSAAFGVYPSQ